MKHTGTHIIITLQILDSKEIGVLGLQVWYLVRLINSKYEINKTLGLGTHLFVNVPRPGDSKVAFSVFESSCHLIPVTTSLITQSER